ncbi:MAG: Crp/Fnr family transcriptional regulator [Litoreibacter sp.]|nr:Crp/Fnr family transcriptional regulator [Litoreibacter sp.]
MKNSLRFEHLLECELLKDMSEDDRIDFLDSCSLRSFSKPTLILAQGEPANGMTLIAEGVVEVSCIGPEGHQSIINHAGPGETLGEIEAIGERMCAASCVAFPGAVTLFCATPLLFGQLRSTVFVRNLLAIQSDRISRDNMFKMVDQFYTVGQRLCKYLHRMSTSTATLTLSQAHLAEIVGCSRQTVNKELGQLRDKELIAINKRKIRVLNREALGALAADMSLDRAGAPRH